MLESVTRRAERGLSLVSLLVGLALGLVVVAQAASLLTQHLRAQRTLLLEARLMQDLRTAADLVARDLRRAGHWGDAAAGLWSPAQPARANPYAAPIPDLAASDATTYAYSRDATENHVLDSNERFGLRLRNKAIELQLGAGNWQALTDATLFVVTAFSITPDVREIDLGALCARPCPESGCPRQQVGSLHVRIAASAVADAGVTRAIEARVRIRNDAITGTCA